MYTEGEGGREARQNETASHPKSDDHATLLSHDYLLLCETKMQRHYERKKKRQQRQDVYRNRINKQKEKNYNERERGEPPVLFFPYTSLFSALSFLFLNYHLLFLTIIVEERKDARRGHAYILFVFSVLYYRVHDGRRERKCHLLEVGGTGGGRCEGNLDFQEIARASYCNRISLPAIHTHTSERLSARYRDKRNYYYYYLLHWFRRHSYIYIYASLRCDYPPSREPRLAPLVSSSRSGEGAKSGGG